MCLIVSGNLFAQDLEDDLTEKKLMNDFQFCPYSLNQSVPISSKRAVLVDIDQKLFQMGRQDVGIHKAVDL